MALRLGVIQLLPDQAVPDVQRIWDAIRACRRTQKDMHSDFNQRLAALGIASISLSSFQRYAMKVRNGEVLRPALTN